LSHTLGRVETVGRGLAQAFHREGNQVIIASRRRSVLEDTARANPGIQSLTVDVENVGDTRRFGAEAHQDITDNPTGISGCKRQDRNAEQIEPPRHPAIAADQWVVARRPLSRPAAPQIKAPVHITKMLRPPDPCCRIHPGTSASSIKASWP
jgi:hypothetical protein